MRHSLSVDHFIQRLKKTPLTDIRRGTNTHYAVSDALLAAFSIFFMQCESFLEGQRELEKLQETTNAQTVFGMEKIPTIPQVRNLLDPVEPSELDELFRYALGELEASGHLGPMRVLDDRLLMSLDGVYYFCSRKISCQKCQKQKDSNGEILYKHSAITPVVVSPAYKLALPYVPEYIVPQDGHDKQDCEQAASKRWLQREKTHLRQWKTVLLGDDLYSKQPLCQEIEEAGLHFIFVCHRSSHPTLYQYVDAAETLGRMPVESNRRWNGKYGEIWSYRYLNGIPLRQGEDALEVNWCELVITHETEGKVLFRNEWITNLPLTKENVSEVAACGRARWKSENENNNVLKRHGYALEHNFGHGKLNLGVVLLSLNLLAFLYHTISQLGDLHYQLLRKELGRRKTFFDDIRALCRYMIFTSWEKLLRFMCIGLKLIPPD